MVKYTTGYFETRTHCTSFNSEKSDALAITASVVQGSALGPVAFAVTASDLHPACSDNRYFKYADDMYLVIPLKHAGTVHQELQHINKWATTNNLELNPSKSSEIVFSKKATKTPLPNLIPGIKRVDSISVLGITVDNKLNMDAHVRETITACSQSLFALRTLRAHGLPDSQLITVFGATTLSKLLYGSTAWWGFASQTSKNMVEAFLRKSSKLGYYPAHGATASEVVAKADSTLFKSVCGNELHVLYKLLPPLKTHQYSLRLRPHNFCLPVKDDRNFIQRMLYQNIC